MKNIDTKSLIIGALLTSTIFLGVAAADDNDKIDKAKYQVAYAPIENWWVDGKVKGESGEGWEPFAVSGDGKKVFQRRRIK
jgi:hypothetical protein